MVNMKTSTGQIAWWDKAVKKTIVFSVIYLCLAATAATGQDAMEFYNRGVKSSLSYKKIEFFTKALQIDPNLAEAYTERAIHYYFQEHFDRAIEDYSRVREIKKTPPTLMMFWL